MGLKNPFRRNRAKAEAESLHIGTQHWWTWGPIGLILYGSHHNSSSMDPGHMNHPGDAGHFDSHIDPGGFGGFDGGGGGV